MLRSQQFSCKLWNILICKLKTIKVYQQQTSLSLCKFVQVSLVLFKNTFKIIYQLPVDLSDYKNGCPHLLFCSSTFPSTRPSVHAMVHSLTSLTVHSYICPPSWGQICQFALVQKWFIYRLLQCLPNKMWQHNVT